MAESGAELSEEEVSLYLWQRAVFTETGTEPVPGPGVASRAAADSLRMKLGQLEYAYWRE